MDQKYKKPSTQKIMEWAAARALLISRKGRKAIASTFIYNEDMIMECRLLDGEIAALKKFLKEEN